MWKDLLGFRRRGGLAGHAEMEGKTLFLKFNTGPRGHGSPPAAGEAIALKRAGRRRRQGLRHRGRGRPDRRGQPRDQELAPSGLGLDNLVLPDRLERLRHRRVPGQRRRQRRPRATGSSRTASASHGTEQGNDMERPPRRSWSGRGAEPGRTARAWSGSRPSRATATASPATSRTARRTSCNTELYWQGRQRVRREVRRSLARRGASRRPTTGQGGTGRSSRRT